MRAIVGVSLMIAALPASAQMGVLPGPKATSYALPAGSALSGELEGRLEAIPDLEDGDPLPGFRALMDAYRLESSPDRKAAFRDVLEALTTEGREALARLQAAGLHRSSKLGRLLDRRWLSLKTAAARDPRTARALAEALKTEAAEPPDPGEVRLPARFVREAAEFGAGVADEAATPDWGRVVSGGYEAGPGLRPMLAIIEDLTERVELRPRSFDRVPDLVRGLLGMAEDVNEGIRVFDAPSLESRSDSAVEIRSRLGAARSRLNAALESLIRSRSPLLTPMVVAELKARAAAPGSSLYIGRELEKAYPENVPRKIDAQRPPSAGSRGRNSIVIAASILSGTALLVVAVAKARAVGFLVASLLILFALLLAHIVVRTPRQGGKSR